MNMLSAVAHSATWRLTMIMILGFASGLPLALTSTALQTWLTLENIDIATIGLFSLVGLPYTFKFLWAPLMDRFEPKFLSRRKAWLVMVQIALALTLFLLSTLNPTNQTQLLALAAVMVAFLSASQDVVIDAYRTDVLVPDERGIGSSLSVFGYRFAMILSGGIALVWADPVAGNGWSWPRIYSIMAVIMLGMAVVSLFLLPSVPASSVAPKSVAKNDLRGFAALVGVVVLGYFFALYVSGPAAEAMMSGIFLPLPDGKPNPDLKKWSDLLSLLIALAVTIPAAIWTTRRAKFETLNTSLSNYFSMPSAYAVLGLIILYKLGDAFAGALTTTFLLKGVGFAQAEIGVVNKVIGIWLTIIGAIAGGALMLKTGLYRALMLFGILQLASNIGFWLVAVLGKDAWGGFDLPAFDFLIVSLKEATRVDWLLLLAIGFENITGGMGTAAFVALLMALCNQKFTATQYALLSAFASVGRVWVGPLAGVLAPAMGWAPFFILSMFMAVPGLAMLWKLKNLVLQLDIDRNAVALDD
jgi:PAT family beta-lactamase induction signal transducer AmpG